MQTAGIAAANTVPLAVQRKGSISDASKIVRS